MCYKAIDNTPRTISPNFKTQDLEIRMGQQKAVDKLEKLKIRVSTRTNLPC